MSALRLRRSSSILPVLIVERRCAEDCIDLLLVLMADVINSSVNVR